MNNPDKTPQIILIAAIALLALTILTAVRAGAQTNTIGSAPAVPQITFNPTPAWMDKTSCDISSLLGDFGIPATPQQIKGLLGLAVAAFFGARLLRKGLPDQWQTGIIGSALKHAALEINPRANAPELTAAIAATPNQPIETKI
jgi:hypothetical protein